MILVSFWKVTHSFSVSLFGHSLNSLNCVYSCWLVLPKIVFFAAVFCAPRRDLLWQKSFLAVWQMIRFSCCKDVRRWSQGYSWLKCQLLGLTNCSRVIVNSPGYNLQFAVYCIKHTKPLYSPCKSATQTSIVYSNHFQLCSFFFFSHFLIVTLFFYM